MEISEVRIKLVEESGERLRAFCSITLDGDFVIRDLKIIDGVSGPFVAMPSRKLADRCPRCGCKNHLRAKFCNDCGLKLNENRAPKDSMGRAKLHADVAHPINAGCRERIQAAVVKAYEAEVERSKSPDYRPPAYDDFGDDDVGHLVEEPARAPAAPAPRPVSPPPPVEDEQDEVPVDAEPSVVAKGRDEEEHFGDYNSLIADLKREAAGRQGRPDRPESPYAQAPRPAPAPPPPRSDRGDREGGRGPQGDARGGRGERQGRDERGPRGSERRDDRRGGPPRDDRRRDQPRRAEESPEPSVPAPVLAKPQPAPAPPPSAADDDFSAGL